MLGTFGVGPLHTLVTETHIIEDGAALSLAVDGVAVVGSVAFIVGVKVRLAPLKGPTTCVIAAFMYATLIAQEAMHRQAAAMALRPAEAASTACPTHTAVAIGVESGA